ncbi:MAG: M24 family metallopeptidase [Candidatus Humimicrobiaceae bacterium]
MAAIPKAEFKKRIEDLRKKMAEDSTDIFIIYGDEYRRENLRYVSNYWPIFERGMLVVGIDKEPLLLASPECEHIAREMSVWSDIRLIREVGMSYVPEEVEFTNVKFTTFKEVINEFAGNKKKIKVKVCGMDAMSVILYRIIASSLSDAIIENGDPILYGLRYIKSQAEIDMLKKAWGICDFGYKAVLDTDIVGLTERQAAAIGEKAARDAGAEHIVFSVFASGERTNSVVGRPSEKIIERNDMILYALAIQYEGYIASDEWPYVAGGKPDKEQKDFIYHLIKAEDLGVKSIKSGVLQGEVVKNMRKYFSVNDLEKYDLYPPIHGNGLSEAESPYPDENSKALFLPGIGINFDVSLFGKPGVGSNRIEEGFIVQEDGLLVLSKLISSMRISFLEKF